MFVLIQIPTTNPTLSKQAASRLDWIKNTHIRQGSRGLHLWESRAPSLEDRTPTAFPTKGPRSFSVDMDYVSGPSKQQQG